jgi:hypothetical protein
MNKNKKEETLTPSMFKSLLDERLNTFERKVDKKLSTLDSKIDKVALSILKTQEDMHVIKETMATKNDVRLITTRMDAFAHRIDVYDKKAVVHDYRFNQLEPKVKDHETRLSALEKRPD